MRKYFTGIIFLLYIISNNSKKSEVFDSETFDIFYLKQKNLEEHFFELIGTITKTIYSELTSNDSRIIITKKCQNIFDNTFNDHEYKNIFFYKMIHDSSKMNNDVRAYKDCYYNYHFFSTEKEIEYIKNNLTYVIFSFNPKMIEENYRENRIFYFTKKTIVGICLPKGCEEKDYAKIFIKICQIVYNSSQINIVKGISAYSMSSEKNNDQNLFLTYFPIIILLFIFSLSIFSNCFFGNNSLGIGNCFNLGENFEEISKNKIAIYDYNLYNDNGLTMFNGLKSIGLLVLIIGEIFEKIYLSPVTISKKNFSHILNQPFFSFIIQSQRFGKKLCFTTSAITLVYKMLSYLDNEIEKMDQNYRENSRGKTFLLREESCFNNSRMYKKYHKMIKWMSLWRFVFCSFHKYIMFWLAVLLYKFSLFNLFSYKFISGPFWLYFKREIVRNFEILNLITYYFARLYKTDLIKFSTANPFKIVLTEINGYCFLAVLIFVFYKNNHRMDYFFFLIAILSFPAKFFYFNYCYFFEHKSFLPAKYYLFSITEYFIHPFFLNYPFFVIGVFFGLINYCIQKTETLNSSKKYTKIPAKIVYFFQKSKNVYGIFFLLVSILFTIFRSFSYYFLLRIQSVISRDNDIQEFFKNYYINLFFLFDNELGVLSILYIVFYFFFSDQNQIINFLKHPLWRTISRLYYVIILNIEIICFYLVYQNDTQISDDKSVILFFIFIGIGVIFSFCLVIFILVEIPLKKLTKFLVSRMTHLKKPNLSFSRSNFSSLSEEK